MSKLTQQEQEALDNHFIRCHIDYPYFARTNHRIQDENNELVPFILNDEQKILEEIWSDIVKTGRMVRIYVLKGRKQGVSTWFTSRSHWMITARGKFKKEGNQINFVGLTKNQNMSVIAHDPKTTAYLFEMCKRIDENVQPELAQKKTKNNGYLIHFKDDENPSGPDSLDSTISVGSADTKDFGSGMTLTISHRSELAKWPAENIKSLLTSLDNAMPAGKNTAVLNESTAKGIGGEFHQGFTTCRYVYEVYQDENQEPHWKMEINEDADPMNEYSSVFIPWFIARKYRRAVPENFKRTAEEEDWVKRYNLSDEQLSWYRWAIPNRCGGDRATRRQEYPMNPQEAFISSGEPAFDVQTIMHLKELCDPPIARYDCLLSNGQFITKADGTLKVWKEPEKSGNYVISADVSEGLAHGDFHSADVLEHDTGEQVAHYHGKMEPWEYASLLIALGNRYNEAWLVPEKNNHGQQVIQELIKADYPNIYMEMIEEPPNKPRKRFGWVTTGAGDRKRQALVDHGKKLIYDGNPGINDPKTYEEMLNFKRQADGKERADNGTFDDCVMSWLIGQYVRESLPYATRTRKGPVDTGRGGNQKKPNPKAFL